jgi:hypothetical protein
MSGVQPSSSLHISKLKSHRVIREISSFGGHSPNLRPSLSSSGEINRCGYSSDSGSKVLSPGGHLISEFSAYSVGKI